MRQAVGRHETLIEFKKAAEELDFFSKSEVDVMGGEWYVYKRLILDFEVLPNTFNNQVKRCSTFWSVNQEVLPNLSAFARYCITMTPSSAAASI